MDVASLEVSNGAPDFVCTICHDIFCGRVYIFVKYKRMATITGSNNTLIGNGAAVPTAGSVNTVVLGGASSTVYMGNAQAGAAGVTVSGGALTLLGSTKLSLSGELGATGATLLSGGAGAAPYWSPAAITVSAASYTMEAMPPALYVVDIGSAACTFNLSNPATVPNTVIMVKNSSSNTCTLSRADDIVDVGATTASGTATVVSGATATVASNGTDWYVVSKQ